MPKRSAAVRIVIRNDDLCALSDPDKERRILSIFERHRIPQVFGVIPNMSEDPHDADLTRFHPIDEGPRMVALLKEYHVKGLIEIAQHGFTHQTNALHPTRPAERAATDSVTGISGRWLPFAPANRNGYSEFNGVDKTTVRSRIQAGRRILETALDVRVTTFLFPWDSLDRAALEEVAALGFENVLCGRADIPVHGLNVMGCLTTDIFALPEWISQLKQVGYPIAAHMEYHSWMLDEPQVARLDMLLARLRAERDVEFTTAAGMAAGQPKLCDCLALHVHLNALTARTNHWRARAIEPTPYTVLSRGFYLREMVRRGVTTLGSRLTPRRRPA